MSLQPGTGQFGIGAHLFLQLGQVLNAFRKRRSGRLVGLTRARQLGVSSRPLQHLRHGNPGLTIFQGSGLIADHAGGQSRAGRGTLLQPGILGSAFRSGGSGRVQARLGTCQRGVLSRRLVNSL